MNISRSGISRRTLLATVGGMAGLPGAATARSREGVRFQADRRPNIVFIMADDLGYADLSCYGRREYKTPEIDALAHAGTRFTHAYANSAVCSATRVGLITGRYQNRLPVGLEEPLGTRDVGLSPDHPTLPSILRDAGYATALIGKWHMGALPKYGPLKSGYDHFWGFRGGGVDYFTHSFMNKHDLWDDDREVHEKGYLTDLLGQKAIETIGQFSTTDKPFFLSLHFNAPHFPWEGPEDQAESARIAASNMSNAVIHFDGGSMKTYAAMVTRMDMQIGRIVRAIDDLKMTNDTIIVFTSDNGGERFSDTWPFTGRKTELLEGGLRIPAIVKWPGRIGAGVVSNQIMISMDWMPTLLAAAGCVPDRAFPSDGIDLLKILSGKAEPRSRTLFWRYLNLAQEACREGEWKYLKILENQYLFNIVEDPLERADLKGRRPDIFKALASKYAAWSATMLPFDLDASTSGFSAKSMPDHFGVNQSRNVKVPITD